MDKKLVLITAALVLALAALLTALFYNPAPQTTVVASYKLFVPSNIYIEGNAAALQYWPRLAGREPLAVVTVNGTAAAAHIFVLINGEVYRVYTVPVPSTTYIYANLTDYIHGTKTLKIEIRVVGV